MSDKEKSSERLKPHDAEVEIPHGSESAVEGVVKVHESVIAAIVRKAACTVPGVLRLSGNTIVDNIAEMVGSKNLFDRSITVEMGESSVDVDVRIVVEYGTRISAVAAAVQSAVSGEITKITGMTVHNVNVLVMDVEDPPARAEEDESEAGV